MSTADASLASWAEGYGSLSTNHSPPVRFSNFGGVGAGGGGGRVPSSRSPASVGRQGPPLMGFARSPRPSGGAVGLSFIADNTSPVSGAHINNQGGADQQFFPSAVSVVDNVASPGPTPVTPASLRPPSTPLSTHKPSTPFSTPLPQKQQQQANVWAQSNLATTGHGPADQSSTSSTSSSTSSSCWVTVFGFPHRNLNGVIESFLSCGQIVQHLSQGNSNWVHLQFETPVGVQRALSRNGTVITGSTMIGVMKRREFGHSGPGVLFNTENNTTSIMGSAKKSSRYVGNESLYLQQRNQYSVAPATAGDFSGAPRQQNSKISTFVNYFFGY